MVYRPDIDGLRAIAVLIVIFYHVGIQPFSGGYVGVDVFFVISGFLITSQILKEIQASEFSIIAFYERRIRRIFPAFFGITIFIMLMGAWLYNPAVYIDIGKSAIAAALSYSNLFFLSQAGYFEAPSTLKPFLHAWSLSVEEQFYLVLPILLVVLYRFAKSKLPLALVVLTILSFGQNVITLSQNPDSAFFLAYLRAWELLIGSFLAIHPFKFYSWVQHVLSVIGLAMILGSVFAYSEATPFPGAAALLPVFGTAMIINSGIFETSITGKLLRLQPLVFIGKISYSLYLWHWPMIVFAKYYLIREITNTDILIILTLMLIVSIFSWRFIEIPFRSRNLLKKPRIFIFAGSMIALVLLSGLAIEIQQGFPSRINKALLPKESSWNSEWKGWGKCLNDKVKPSEKLITCPLGEKGRPADFLVWGDSHGKALASAVNRSAAKTGTSGSLIVRSGCPPLLGVDRQGRNQECYQHNNKVLEYINEHPEIKKVILVGRWSISAVGSRYKTEDGPNTQLVDITNAAHSATNASVFETGLDRTIDELIQLDREVIITYPIPEIGYDVPSSLLIALRTGRDINSIIAPSWEEYQQRNKVVFSVFEKMREKYKSILFIDITKRLCDPTKCRVSTKNKSFYVDDDHLSTLGALKVSDQFDSIWSTIHK